MMDALGWNENRSAFVRNALMFYAGAFKEASRLSDDIQGLRDEVAELKAMLGAMGTRVGVRADEPPASSSQDESVLRDLAAGLGDLLGLGQGGSDQ